jgi:hypothetical protein
VLWIQDYNFDEGFGVALTEEQASATAAAARKVRITVWPSCNAGSAVAVLLDLTVERVKDARKSARKGGNEVEEEPFSQKAAKVTKASTRKVTKNQAANKRHVGGAHTVKKAIAKKKR